MVWQGGSAGCLCWLAGCHCWLAGCHCWLAQQCCWEPSTPGATAGLPSSVVGNPARSFQFRSGRPRQGWGSQLPTQPCGCSTPRQTSPSPGRNRGNRRTVPLFLVTTSPIAIRIEPVGFSCGSHGKVTCAPFIFPSNLYEKTLRRYETRSSEAVANGCQTHWLQKSRTLFRRLKLQTRPRDAVAADC